MYENQFERWHPLTHFAYYVAVIVLMTIKMNPFIIAITLLCSIILGVAGWNHTFLKSAFKFYFPASVLAIIINPLFSHEGVTILEYFPDGNPLTLESIYYGIASGMMICGLCCVFFTFNKVMTADKIMYLTGRIVPAVSLVISMVLRFIPEFKRHMSEVNQAKKGMNLNMGKFRGGIVTMNAMIMWAFEKSIDRSDSMRARGYGVKRRTSFSVFCMSKRDIAYMLFILVVFCWLVFNLLSERLYTQFYPYFYVEHNLLNAFFSYGLYAALVMLPVIDIVKENIKWKSLQSKI